MWSPVANDIEDEDIYDYKYVYSDTDDNGSAAGGSDGDVYSDENDSTAGGRLAATDGDDPMDMDVSSQSGVRNGQGTVTADSTAPSLLHSEDFGVTGDADGAVSNTDTHSNGNNMERGDTRGESEILEWDPRHSLNAREAIVRYRGNLTKVHLTNVVCPLPERYFSPVVSGVKYDTITKIPYR